MTRFFAISIALAFAWSAAAEIEVPDYEKQIAAKQREVERLDRQDPYSAAQASRDLDQLRHDAAEALAAFGERALDEEYDLALAEQLLERGQDIDQVDELALLATRIADIRSEVVLRHSQASYTYERLSGDPDIHRQVDAWFELLEEYRDLVRWHEVDREIKKIHDRIGKKIFPLLIGDGEAAMVAGDHRRAAQRYEAAIEVKPKAEDLQARAHTARDYCRADELAEEAEALLDADEHEFVRAIELYDEALALHEDHTPLVEGRDLANRRGIEVLLADAARAHDRRKDLEASQLLQRARSLSTTHAPTLAALDEAEAVYGEALARRLAARGDEYAGYDDHARAYVEYALAEAVYDGATVEQRMDDALARITKDLHYTVAVTPPAHGDVSGWGDLSSSFFEALRPRMESALDGTDLHAGVTFRNPNGADAVVSGEFRSFDVALDYGDENWCKARLDASLEIQIQPDGIDAPITQLLTYSNTHEGYPADEAPEGTDPTQVVPDDDACIQEILDALADQTRDAVLAHVRTHGDRWKVHFEQQHANWQNAQGIADLLLLLLSDPCHSKEAADWARAELRTRWGLRWDDRSADLEHIRLLTR